MKVAVAVAEEALGRLHEVAAMCRALGFDHDWTLNNVGVLTGFFDNDGLAQLRSVPGVVAVEIERPIRPAVPGVTTSQTYFTERRVARRAN